MAGLYLRRDRTAGDLHQSTDGRGVQAAGVGGWRDRARMGAERTRALLPASHGRPGAVHGRRTADRPRDPRAQADDAVRCVGLRAGPASPKLRRLARWEIVRDAAPQSVLAHRSDPEPSRLDAKGPTATVIL